MRLMQRDLKTVYLKKRVVGQDDEANDVYTFSKDCEALKMVIRSGGGAVLAQIYGDRLPYIKSCQYQGDLLNEGQNEGDGICLNVSSDEEPDYKINSIQTFTHHKNVILERIEQNGRGV